MSVKLFLLEREKITAGFSPLPLSILCIVKISVFSLLIFEDFAIAEQEHLQKIKTDWEEVFTWWINYISGGNKLWLGGKVGLKEIFPTSPLNLANYLSRSIEELSNWRRHPVFWASRVCTPMHMHPPRYEQDFEKHNTLCMSPSLKPR